MTSRTDTESTKTKHNAQKPVAHRKYRWRENNIKLKTGGRTQTENKQYAHIQDS